TKKINRFTRETDAQSETTALQIAHGEASHPRYLEGGGSQRMPALSRAETAASRVRQLRVLSRPAGASGRRRVVIWVAVDAMGGDYAPRHVVDGALAAAKHFELGVAL